MNIAASSLQKSSTRLRILAAAHDEMYRVGFQGMRIEHVLQRVNLAKGALYHHFSSKQALGYAVIDEFLMQRFEDAWREAFARHTNPIDAMQYLMAACSEDIQNHQCFNGCPLTNLVQEMAALDSGFQTRLLTIQQHVIAKLTESFSRAKTLGFIRADVDPERTALFFHAAYQGIMSVTKCLQAPTALPALFASLTDYLDSLRPQSHIS